MKFDFGSTVTLPSSKLHEDELDVVVTADILEGDRGGLHAPPSGMIPEILEVVIDPNANVDGTRYEPGEIVTQLIDEETIIRLEDMALTIACEMEQDQADEEPPERENDDD